MGVCTGFPYMANEHCTAFFSIDEGENVNLELDTGDVISARCTSITTDTSPNPDSTYEAKVLRFEDESGRELVGGVQGSLGSPSYTSLRRDGDSLGYVVDVQ